MVDVLSNCAGQDPAHDRYLTGAIFALREIKTVDFLKGDLD